MCSQAGTRSPRAEQLRAAGFKMLKRHIGAEHGLTEAAYRETFGLPDDFALVAPDYSELKAKTAKKLGLGTYDRTSPKVATEATP